jgi:8-oxo-dGTP diphosphatase
MQTTEPSRPKVGVAVFIYRNGQFIAIQRSGSHGEGTWSLPGGHLEFGESWEQCAKREAIEEIGSEITNVQFLAATNDLFEAEGKHYVTIWMTADWQANEPESKEPDKVIGLQWIDFAHLPQPLFEPCWTNLRAVRPDLFNTTS